MMAAQKRKKKMLAEFFVFLNVYLPKTQQIRFTTFLILSYHMEDCEEIKKQGL